MNLIFIIMYCVMFTKKFNFSYPICTFWDRDVCSIFCFLRNNYFCNKNVEEMYRKKAGEDGCTTFDTGSHCSVFWIDSFKD